MTDAIGSQAVIAAQPTALKCCCKAVVAVITKIIRTVQAVFFALTKLYHYTMGNRYIAARNLTPSIEEISHDSNDLETSATSRIQYAKQFDQDIHRDGPNIYLDGEALGRDLETALQKIHTFTGGNPELTLAITKLACQTVHNFNTAHLTQPLKDIQFANMTEATREIKIQRNFWGEITLEAKVTGTFGAVEYNPLEDPSMQELAELSPKESYFEGRAFVNFHTGETLINRNIILYRSGVKRFGHL